MVICNFVYFTLQKKMHTANFPDNLPTLDRTTYTELAVTFSFKKRISINLPNLYPTYAQSKGVKTHS